MMQNIPAIAYLGPDGTYTAEAARQFAHYLGLNEPELVPCISFNEVFDNVEDNQCEYGVVAIENSIEGSVTATLDEFAFRDSIVILGEEVIDIHHCLVVNPATRMDRITRVVSHPQGLGQCREHLRELLPGVPTSVASSTAESVKMAADDPTIAGIGNSHAAELYEVRIAASDIEDRAGNQTSFALIARKDHPAVFTERNMKTSLALFLKDDRAGALLMILSEFAYAGINLTKIQSRPTKNALGEYMFLVDLETSLDNPQLQTALASLELKLRQVKILGSYPLLTD